MGKDTNTAMRIIFMGTPDFAVPSLERLVAEGYLPVAVVTGPDRPRGRGQRMSVTPIKKKALQMDIEPILQPESVKDPAFVKAIEQLFPDVIVVVAFRILPPEVFTIAVKGAFNLHGSLLPKFRGAAPINRAVMAGETETGVTTFFLKKKVDTGNIILSRHMAVGPNETAGDVHDRMMMLGADVVLETIKLIETGNVVTLEQDDTLATPAPKIFRQECHIPWHQPATVVHNHIRGLSPFPGAWTEYGDKLLKMFRSRIAAGSGDPGRIIRCEDELVIACSNGAVEILQLQQQGRQKLDVATFLRGFSFSVGDRLC